MTFTVVDWSSGLGGMSVLHGGPRTKPWSSAAARAWEDEGYVHSRGRSGVRQKENQEGAMQNQYKEETVGSQLLLA